MMQSSPNLIHHLSLSLSLSLSVFLLCRKLCMRHLVLLLVLQTTFLQPLLKITTESDTNFIPRSHSLSLYCSIYYFSTLLQHSACWLCMMLNWHYFYNTIYKYYHCVCMYVSVLSENQCYHDAIFIKTRYYTWWVKYDDHYQPNSAIQNHMHL